jgi:hypothetical protein
MGNRWEILKKSSAPLDEKRGDTLHWISVIFPFNKTSHARWISPRPIRHDVNAIFDLSIKDAYQKTPVAV